MKKINLSKPTLILSGLLVAVFAGSGFFFYQILKPQPTGPDTKTTEVLGETISASPIPSQTPTPSPSPSVKPSVKPAAKPSLKPSAKPSPSVAASPSPVSSPSSSPAVLGTTASPSPSPTSSPSPAISASPSPTPSVQTVNVEVQGSGFKVEISGDLNVCQVMEKAKEQGKISSLTLDNSYQSSLNSQYVREMNGLSNNWTFKVNGNSPLGCSLYQVKPNDQIVWKFG